MILRGVVSLLRDFVLSFYRGFRDVEVWGAWVGFDFFVQGGVYCGVFVWSGVLGVVYLQCCRFDGEFYSNE